jgi:uncharacterized DUF497 family protein
LQFTFEFDEAKSAANKAKHGIDFSRAQALWQDERLLRIAARPMDEQRFVPIGTIAGRHWSAVVTYRGEAIRLISVRSSRAREVQAYEGQ